LQSISKAVQELVGHLVRGVAGWTRATTYSTRAVLPSNRSRFTLAFLTRALDLMIIELSILPLMIEEAVMAASRPLTNRATSFAL
jgi:hypothetical protein